LDVHYRDYDSLSKEDVFKNNKLVSENGVFLVLFLVIIIIQAVAAYELNREIAVK